MIVYKEVRCPKCNSKVEIGIHDGVREEPIVCYCGFNNCPNAPVQILACQPCELYEKCCNRVK